LNRVEEQVNHRGRRLNKKRKKEEGEGHKRKEKEQSFAREGRKKKGGGESQTLPIDWHQPLKQTQRQSDLTNVGKEKKREHS